MNGKSYERGGDFILTDDEDRGISLNNISSLNDYGFVFQ